MKRILLISVISLVPILLLGQNVSSLQENNDSLVKKLLEVPSVGNLKTILDQIKKVEPKNVVTPQKLNMAFDSLITFTAHEIERRERKEEENKTLLKYKDYEKDALDYRLLSCRDTSVFSESYESIDMEKLLPCLRDHIEAIKTIQSYSECIKNIESTIKEVEDVCKDSPEEKRKEVVGIAIDPAINTVNNLLDQIDSLNMSSFSPEQRKFYNDLSERLTNILEEYVFDYGE